MGEIAVEWLELARAVGMLSCCYHAAAAAVVVVVADSAYVELEEVHGAAPQEEMELH